MSVVTGVDLVVWVVAELFGFQQTAAFRVVLQTLDEQLLRPIVIYNQTRITNVRLITSRTL